MHTTKNVIYLTHTHPCNHTFRPCLSCWSCRTFYFLLLNLLAGIVGRFTFSPLPDTQGSGGANVFIDIEGGLTRELEILPRVGFEYHIHVKQVGAKNNCEATGGHLDPNPLQPGIVPCDSSSPDKCQAGDLSGKYLLFFFYRCRVEITIFF